MVKAATSILFKNAVLSLPVCFFALRCSPAGESASRFVIQSEIALDRLNGVSWQRADDGVLRDWNNATAYCARLRLGGFADWRLPSLDELTSIVDSDKKQRGLDTPAIDAAVFPDTKTFYYWTATDDPDNPDYVRNVYFYDGWVDYYAKFDTNYVRCVRSQQ